MYSNCVNLSQNFKFNNGKNDSTLSVEKRDFKVNIHLILQLTLKLLPINVQESSNERIISNLTILRIEDPLA